MPYYKAPDNTVHFLEDSQFSYLLPPDLVEITDEEAEALIPSSAAEVTSVTMRQARLALLEAGLLSQVSLAIASLPSPQKEAAEIEWEFAQTVDKVSPLISMLAPALNLTEEQMNQLFTRAAEL